MRQEDLPRNDYHMITRNIDWTRGQPYVWRSENLSELLASDFCFARKFDWAADAAVIKSIEAYLIERAGAR